MILKHFFASNQSFLDPLKTSDGKPYNPFRFKQIVEECWFISKNIHTSYNELLDITPTERTYLRNMIIDDMERSTKRMQQVIDETKNKNHN